MRFEYNERDNLKLDAFKEMMIFRIVQEGLNNIQKTCRIATKATVSLKQEDNQVVLIVSDNGLGFEMSSTNQGLGLLSIRNRSQPTWRMLQYKI